MSYCIFPCLYLHSTMSLLKRPLPIPEISPPNIFTFHYVTIKTNPIKHSINSPKTLFILSTSFFISSLNHHFIFIISYTSIKSNTKLSCQPPLFLTLSTIDNIIKRNLFYHPPCPTFLYLAIFLDGF